MQMNRVPGTYPSAGFQWSQTSEVVARLVQDSGVLMAELVVI